MSYQMFSNLASAYGAGTYGGCSYDNATCSSAAAGGAQQSATSGSLVNTGTILLFIVSLACLIVCASLIIRFANRKKQVAITDYDDDVSARSAR